MIIKIHDEQVRVNGIDPIIESSVSSMVADYQDTEEQLYLLLSYYEDRPVSVTARKGEVDVKDRVDVYINPNNKKRLAEAVVKKVRHCFDPSMKRSENAEDAAIIIETAKAWLETIPDSDIVPPSRYPWRVFDRAMVALGARREEGVMTPPRYDFPPEGVTIDGVTISDEQVATIVEQVGKWVRKQEQLLTAQPGYKEQPPTAQPDPRLQTEEAIKYFRKAIELGLMSEDYKWENGLEVLACFAREMSLELNLGKGTNSDGSKRIAWKPFEQLFGVKNLRGNYNDIQKTGQDPQDAYLIKEIFK